MLAFVGSVNADTIAVVPRLPELDERMVASDISFGAGGNAATAAVAAARAGAEVAFIGPVSESPEGRRLLEELAAEGIDVSGVVWVPPQAGGTSVILVDEKTGARSICVHPAADFALTGRGAALVASAAWVHVDQLGWGAVNTAGPKAIGAARLSVDAGNPIPGFDVSGLDLYGPTVSVLRTTYGDLPVADLIAASIADGARCVVATNGADGAYGAASGTSVVAVPAFTDAEVRSTLGAGDVFHGALLVAMSRGWDLRIAMTFACASAALSCRAIDARSAIPTGTELREYLADRKIVLP